MFDDYRRILEQIAGIVSGSLYDPRHDMHFIDPRAVPNSDWFIPDGARFYVPRYLGTICPKCHQYLFIDVEVVGGELVEILSVAMRGRCPRSVCGFSEIKIFLVGVRNKNQVPQCLEIWMLPDPGLRRQTIFEGVLDERLFRAYRDAIQTFNGGMFSPSITCCGRVIEGICKAEFPKSKNKDSVGALFSRLQEALRSNQDYPAILNPIIEIGKALKLSRDPASHFDLQKEPNKDIASRVLDLTEFLIKYVYLISDEARDLDEAVRLLGPDDLEP